MAAEPIIAALNEAHAILLSIEAVRMIRVPAEGT